MTCPICRHEPAWPIPFRRAPEIDAWRSETKDAAPYNFLLCRQCGNAYPSPPPAIGLLQRLWAENRIDPGATPAEKKKLWSHRRAIAKAGAARSYRLFSALPGKATGRFLDIACGLGETVNIFAANGWDAEGIDADPSTEPSHRQLGIKSRIGQFEQAEIGASYDIIHIAHAIYFITDPMSFMRLVRERLAGEGYFCVVLADFMASSDPVLPGYVHSFFPTARSMRYALALAGFETVFCKRVSGSIFIAARPADDVTLPAVWPAATLALYRSKALRYQFLGRPYLALRAMAKSLLTATGLRR